MRHFKAITRRADIETAELSANCGTSYDPEFAQQHKHRRCPVHLCVQESENELHCVMQAELSSVLSTIYAMKPRAMVHVLYLPISLSYHRVIFSMLLAVLAQCDLPTVSVSEGQLSLCKLIILISGDIGLLHSSASFFRSWM